MKSFAVKNSLMRPCLATKNGKRFMYEHVTHLKTISVNMGLDTIINEGVNVPRRSIK